VYNKTKEFVLGQHQNVSGHHQTHLARAIGQSVKKDADTTFFLYHLQSRILFYFGAISPKSGPKKNGSNLPKGFFFLKPRFSPDYIFSKVASLA
jgi:hypothetical protein